MRLSKYPISGLRLWKAIKGMGGLLRSMLMVSKGRIINILASFLTVAVLSIFLLSLFPFYPLYIALGLAIVLGIVGIELPGLALLLSVLLSVLGATYQNPFIGLTFLVILILLSSDIRLARLSDGWGQHSSGFLRHSHTGNRTHGPRWTTWQ